MNTDLYKRKVPFLGRIIQHNVAEIHFLDQMLYENHFDTIIELGTADGGLTLLFGLHALAAGSIVVTFDLGREPTGGTYKALKPLLPIAFFNNNVFSDEGMRWIKDYMKRGRVLLYCDDGKKPREFNTFAPFLKPNDVIMAHDRDVEIFLEDISDTINKYNLKPFLEKEIQKLRAGIFSFIKTG